MEFEKSITTEEIVWMHEKIVAKFTQGHDRVDNAKELSKAAIKTADDASEKLIRLISVLNKKRRNKMITAIRKIVSATNLHVAAEIILEKQEHETRQA